MTLKPLFNRLRLLGVAPDRPTYFGERARRSQARLDGVISQKAYNYQIDVIERLELGFIGHNEAVRLLKASPE